MCDADDHLSSYLENPFPLLLRWFRPFRLSGTTSTAALSYSLLSTRGTTLESDWEVSFIGLRLRCQARLPEGYKTAALWIVETMAQCDATEESAADRAQETMIAEQGSGEDDALLNALTLAGEEVIQAIAQHADNPRPLAERLARWVVEMVK